MKKLTKIKTLAIMIGFMMVGIMLPMIGIGQGHIYGPQTIIMNGGSNEKTVVINLDSAKNNAVVTVRYCKSVNVSIYNNDTAEIRVGAAVSVNFVTNNNFLPTIKDTTVYIYFCDTAHGGVYPGLTGNVVVHFIQDVPKMSVCFITVDTSSTNNIIIWDTTGLASQNTDSVKIWFFNSKNSWQLLASKSYKDTIQYYVDQLNNPKFTTTRYCVTAKNLCGNEELPQNSIWQNTMWITSVNDSTFSWAGTGYIIEGDSANPKDSANQSVLTYILYRDSIGKNIVGNDSIIWISTYAVSGTQNVISDPNYSIHKKSSNKWYVGAELNVPGCPAPKLALDRKPEILNNAISHSNKISINSGGITSVSIIQNEIKSMVYPNPSNGVFRVNLTSFDNKCVINIYNSVGQSIYQNILEKNDDDIRLNGITPGFYMYTITNSENNSFISKGKFIIQ